MLHGATAVTLTPLSAAIITSTSSLRPLLSLESGARRNEIVRWPGNPKNNTHLSNRTWRESCLPLILSFVMNKACVSWCALKLSVHLALAAGFSLNMLTLVLSSQKRSNLQKCEKAHAAFSGLIKACRVRRGHDVGSAVWPPCWKKP